MEASEMHRIDHPTAAPGGLFTIGDPIGGTAATIVTDDWLNSVQEEIVAVIDEAGIALSKPDSAQLLAAIESLIATRANAFQTGDVILTMRPSASTGWVLCNDGTIGNAGSSATTRANADTQPLYTLIWNAVSNTYAPVTGGRGASAAADFAANKAIALTKMLGRALGIAGAGSGLTTRTLGQTVGAETHTLTAAEIPAHTHPIPVGGAQTGGGSQANYWQGTGPLSGSSTSANTGGGGAHNIMQPTAFLHAHIRL
jgi:hypothetical protein